MMKHFLVVIILLILFLFFLCCCDCLTEVTQEQFWIQRVAGNGTNGYGGDGGPATSASLKYPRGLWLDSTGSLYICDRLNYRIRVVASAGIISTFGGAGNHSFSGTNGAIANVSFYLPYAIIGDTQGKGFYFADAMKVWYYSFSSGIISVIAGTSTRGSSGDGGPATSAQLNTPMGLMVTRTSLFIVDRSNCNVRVITLSSNIINRYAGGLNADSCGYGGDGGQATSASLKYPEGIWTSTLGESFIADTSNHRIRKVDSLGIISTFAGNGNFGSGGDKGPATAASFNYPIAITGDSLGNIFISDTYNCKIRFVNPALIINTLLGTGLCGSIPDESTIATSGQIHYPRSLYLDTKSNLYFSDDYGNVYVRNSSSFDIFTSDSKNGINSVSCDISNNDSKNDAKYSRTLYTTFLESLDPNFIFILLTLIITVFALSFKEQALTTEIQRLRAELKEEARKKEEQSQTFRQTLQQKEEKIERLTGELNKFSVLDNKNDDVDMVALMTSLGFPLDLQYSCAVVLFEAEKAHLRSLSAEDVSAKMTIGQRLKPLTAFIKQVVVNPSQHASVNLEKIENMLVEYDVHLLTEDENKLMKMADFLQLFGHAKSRLPIALKSAIGKGLAAFSKNLLPKPLPVLSAIPLPPGKETHCFLTHNWANGNHEKVSRINDALKRRGLVTWFDSERMKDQVRQTMTDALAKTASVVILVTKIYEAKINTKNQADNCYFEFNYVSHHPTLPNKRIAAATEKEMVYPGNWDPSGRLFSEMGGYLVLDVSEEEDETIFEKQIDELALRIQEKINKTNN